MATAPPPFVPGGEARKKSSTPLIILIVVVALIALCVGGVLLVVWAVGGAMRTVMPMAGCVASFQLARDAVIKYSRDHGDVLPDAAKWQDEVTPYLSKEVKEMKNAPFDFKVIQPGKPWGCTDAANNMTGLAFNSNLSGKKFAEVESPYSTVMIFEIEAPRMNAAEPYKKRDDASSPKLMGKPRGWISIPMMGEGDFGKFGNESIKAKTD